MNAWSAMGYGAWGTTDDVALPNLFKPYGTLPTRGAPTAWKVTYGPWRPRDERVFQEAVQRYFGTTYEAVYDVWSKGVLALGGPLADPFLRAFKALGGNPDPAIEVEGYLARNHTPNPSTSRPEGGLPNASDDLPGWHNLLPYYYDPSLLPRFQVSPEASVTELAKFPTVAAVNRLIAEVKRIYPTGDYRRRVVALLEADLPRAAQAARVSNAQFWSSFASSRGVTPQAAALSTVALPSTRNDQTSTLVIIAGGALLAGLLGYALTR